MTGFGVMADLALIATVEDLAAVWADDQVLDRARGIGPLAQLFNGILPLTPLHGADNAEPCSPSKAQHCCSLGELS